MRSSTLPRVLVTTAGGFIGNHLVTALKQRGYWMRGADITPSDNHATILRDNALINIHTPEAARVNGASRYQFSSSSCVYPEHLQAEANVAPMKEEEAYPASPQDAYGWEKLIAECLCQYYTGEFGVERRVVRLHKIYRPMDNHRLREVPGWEPSVTLRQGLEPTYRWSEKQVLSRRLLLAATGG